jgi:hypothetical protein
MSRRSSIVKALAEKFNTLLDGSAPYNFNLYSKAEPKLKFWDECLEFPAVFVTPGSEQREYHPSGFTWGHLGVCLKVYVKSDSAQEDLEVLLETLERLIDDNRVLVYDVANNYDTTEILIESITTDEGLLHPYGVGEINLLVRYQIMKP